MVAGRWRLSGGRDPSVEIVLALIHVGLATVKAGHTALVVLAVLVERVLVAGELAGCNGEGVVLLKGRRSAHVGGAHVRAAAVMEPLVELASQCRLALVEHRELVVHLGRPVDVVPQVGGGDVLGAAGVVVFEGDGFEGAGRLADVAGGGVELVEHQLRCLTLARGGRWPHDGVVEEVGEELEGEGGRKAGVEEEGAVSHQVEGGGQGGAQAAAVGVVADVHAKCERDILRGGAVEAELGEDVHQRDARPWTSTPPDRRPFGLVGELPREDDGAAFAQRSSCVRRHLMVGAVGRVSAHDGQVVREFAT